MTPCPIEIIGGGLAGLSLGLSLRRENVPVTVFEAGHYPRHRVCGEFITGLSRPTRTKLGLDAVLTGALEHREVAWFIDGECAQVQRLPVPALGISRHILDSRLATEFVAAGGTLRVDTRINTSAHWPGRVFATGRRLGHSPWLGLKLHARGLELARDLEFHLGDHAYAGLCRVESDSVNVCGLFRRQSLSARGPELLLAYLEEAGFHSLAQRLARAELPPETFCAVAALNFDRRVGSGPRVVLGDACAMTPPFTGNGMAMAFQGAEAACDPLVAFSRGERGWPETCRVIHAALKARFRTRLASATALHPFLLRPSRQRWIAALSRARMLPFGPLYRLLH